MEGNDGMAILLLLAMLVAGVIIVFNLVPALNIGFNNITSVKNGIWIVASRIVGLALAGVSLWAIINIIRN